MLTFSKVPLALLCMAMAGSSNAANSGISSLFVPERRTEECYDPQLYLLGLFNFSAPWPPQCTLCDTAGEEACYNNACWCIPEGGSEGCCPDPGERPISYAWQVAEAFRKNRLTLSDPILLEPAGCDPWEINLELFPNLTVCNPIPGTDNPNAVCAFIYADDDQHCGGLDGRDYGLQTFESFEAAEEAGAIVTHYGACGVCSNAHDLSIMMDPRSVYDGSRGNCAAQASVGDVASGIPVREGATFQCYKNFGGSGSGFTDECAFLHASSDYAGRACTPICLEVLGGGISPNNYQDCGLNGCLTCEANFRKDQYIKWAGRNLVNSGLIAYNQFYHVKYNCSVYDENKIIFQDPYINGKDSNKILDSAHEYPPMEPDSADRFNPSYNILLNQETCLYDLSFSMKHDPTLPHAGGWDTSLPGGVTREEFAAHCAREANAIADDGMPYRTRRMHKFDFGLDVREITGTFDHLNIDFNPCGHHDEIYFGRAHYDLHFYTVPYKWKDIMDCDVTSCDPQDCKFDQTFQSSEVGKAFFDMDVCTEPFPAFIPADVPVKPGSFNKNMPFGFMLISHAGNPHSGLHSLNVATAMGWNDTQVDYWTYPVQFMMSFDSRVVTWEPMVPTEFFQGSKDREFSSPESPPLCQTYKGIPLTYNAKYNATTGYVTFQVLGRSPGCACNNSLLSQAECDAHYEEEAKYTETYKKFTGGKTLPPPPPPKMFGKYSVEDVEDAFGLEKGSLIVRGTKKFDKMTKNNFWSDYVGIPVILSRLTTIVTTPRNSFFSLITSLGSPTFVYMEDRYFEQPLLGCFYRPKPENVSKALDALGLELCNDGPSSFAGVIVGYQVVGYINEHKRLLYYGRSPDYVHDLQFLTQLVVSEIQLNATLEGDDKFVYRLMGPNHGEYEGYADPPAIQTLNFLGNHGLFEVAVMQPNLTAPCPDKFCGNFIPGIPNPLAPNAPWPDKVYENQCLWFPCAELPTCTPADSPFSDQCPVASASTTASRKKNKKKKMTASDPKGVMDKVSSKEGKMKSLRSRRKM